MEIDEKTQSYLRTLARTIAQGPLAPVVLDLAAGRRRIVVKQLQEAAGWFVTTEVVEQP